MKYVSVLVPRVLRITVAREYTFNGESVLYGAFQIR